MKWVNVRHADNADTLGVVHEGEVRVLDHVTSLLALIQEGTQTLADAGAKAFNHPVQVLELAKVQLAAPLPVVGTVRDFYAFEQHVRTARKGRGLDMDPDWYELPVFYFSNPYAVCGNDVDVPMAPGTAEMDYELEVAAVVGSWARNATVAEAQNLVAGYMIMNDWSARDIQRREMKLSMGPVKGKDFATGFGPYFVTPDEVHDAWKPGATAPDLAMVARVNGVEYSRASLADVYYSFGQMISYASRGTQVAPGDIIGSGTCGTGCILELSLTHGLDAYPYLKPGDVVELEVERLGILRNTVVESLPLHPLTDGESSS